MNLFLLACGALSPVYANPVGEVVSHGSAAFDRQGNTLTVTQKSDRAIVGWQDFSNRHGEVTRFVQPSAKSSILNRVTGGTRSTIEGRIEANGQVVLINPNGVTVGPSGVVNTQSFLGSTLDTTNEEFLAGGAMNFKGASAADFTNLGTIHTAGGDALIVSRQINNAGTIEAPRGTAGLAAGSEVLIQPNGDQRIFVKAGSESGGISHSGAIRAAAAEIKASGNPYSAGINLSGWVTATGASTKKAKVQIVSGGPVKVSGTLSARNANGNGGVISLTGSEVTAQAATLTASGRTGGTIDITGDQVTLGSLIDASGSLNGGSVVVSAGDLNLSGQVLATGTSGAGGTVGFTASRFCLELPASVVNASGGLRGGAIRHVATLGLASSGTYLTSSAHGQGGSIALSAARLSLTAAHLDASGATGGGSLRIGGEYQGGKNLASPTLPNAETLTADGATTFQADGRAAGAKGGRIVLWSNQATTVSSTLSAQAGARGLGSLIEVSSASALQFSGTANAGAGGTVLFDPKDIVVSAVGLNGLPAVYGSGNTLPFTITPSTITSILNTGSSVVLQANNDITVLAPITANNPTGNGGALTLSAGRSLFISANLTSDNGNVTLIANDTTAHGVVDSYRDLGVAAITFLLGAGIDAGAGNVNILLDTGAGKTYATSGVITLGPITARDLTVNNAGLTVGSNIAVAGNVNATGNIALTTTGDLAWNLGSALNYNGNGGGKTLSLVANGDITTVA